MPQQKMNVLVPQKLKELEQDRNIKVLYAVESGSRTWGCASPDSDFDVRFIYIRPKDYYLCLEDTRDVIEMPIDDTWDVSGWDLKKALLVAELVSKKLETPELGYIPNISALDDYIYSELASLRCD